MANEITWVVKKGATGTVRTGTLTNSSGAIDLTNKTVTMNVRATEDGPKLIDNASVTKTTPQTAGGISYSFTADNLTALSVGEYLLEFKLVEGATVDFVPTDDDADLTYGRLVVQKSLN